MLSAYARSSYARLLTEQIKRRAPVSPLTFILRGSKGASFHRITFSGSPYLLDRAQIEQLLENKRSFPNLAIDREGRHLKVHVDPPPELPFSVLALKNFYANEKERLIGEEMSLAPEERFAPGRLGAKLKALSLEILRRAAEIAEKRTVEKFGKKEDQGCLLMVAGSARGPELDSDLDYMLVYHGKNRGYFDFFAAQMEDILFCAGADGDNIIARFSNGRINALQLDDLDDYNLIFRVAAGALPVEGFNNESVLSGFFDRLNAVCESKERLLTHFSWYDIFYAIQVRSNNSQLAAVNPSLETRRLNIALGILEAKAGLTMHRLAMPELLTELQKDHGLVPPHIERISEASLFFRRMKNALWYLYRGSTPYLIKTDLPLLEQLMKCNHGSLESFMAEMARHKSTAEELLVYAKREGNFSPLQQKAYYAWRFIKEQLRRGWNFIKFGGLSVVLYSKRLAPNQSISSLLTRH